jgi:RNA polymerase sigma-70 factor (ECF subfamily)
MNDLQRRLAEGEEAAFTECYDAYADRLYRYLLVRLRSAEDAADVLQNVFVRLVRYRRRIGNVENLTTYLFRIAHNEAHRSQQQSQVKTEALSSQQISGQESATLSLETVDAAMAALERLTGAAREVVELKIFASCTFHEIAEILSVPQGTAATRYRQALLELRQWFAKEELL